MGKDEELITLVVHTEEFAFKLKDVLEFHDVPVTLENLDEAGIHLAGSPKKVRIPLSRLDLGLKVLESGKDALEPTAVLKMTGMGKTLLIPVDFSPLGSLAVKVGFFLAEKFGVEPVLLHSYISSYFESPEISAQVTPDFTLQDEMNAAEEAVEDNAFKKVASSKLAAFRRLVRKEQEQGLLPDIRFSTALLEGIPELVIQEYCKAGKPMMVVMATRAARKKGMDLVGSVTAEVIDSCRVPVISIPESFRPAGVDKIRNVAMFCSFSGYDTIVLRWLMRTFDYPSCSFYLLPATDRHVDNVDREIENLKFYFGKNYPTAEFHAAGYKGARFEDRVKSILEENDIDLIIVPNKKSSAFSRFFKPTLAHKILFEKDIPLIVIPV